MCCGNLPSYLKTCFVNSFYSLRYKGMFLFLFFEFWSLFGAKAKANPWNVSFRNSLRWQSVYLHNQLSWSNQINYPATQFLYKQIPFVIDWRKEGMTDWQTEWLTNLIDFCIFCLVYFWFHLVFTENCSALSSSQVSELSLPLPLYYG